MTADRRRGPAAALIAASTLALSGCAGPDDLAPFDRENFDRLADAETVPADRAAEPRERAAADEPAPLPPEPTLDDLVEHAARNNPGLEAAFNRWRAAAERALASDALPDPRFTFGVYLEEVETRTGPQQARFGVAQTFPALGSLKSRADAAAAAARAAWRRFEAERLALRERVVEAVYELRYLDDAVAVAAENVELVEQLESVVRARYRVDRAGHPELVRAQVEIGKLRDRLRALRDLRPARLARLNAALDRPAGAETAIPADPPDRVANTDADALERRAKEFNPGLLAFDEEVDRRRAATEGARALGAPDITVGLEYIFTGDAVNPATAGSGDDPVVLTFGVNLPIWRDAYDAHVRSALAARYEAAGRRAGARNALAADLHQAWYDHTDAARRAELYETALIPKARESLEASLAAFRAAESSFLDLLETERTLLEFQLAAARARADIAVSLARLERLAGGPIETQPLNLPEDQR